GRQWISLGGGIDLLDMPGILWPKLENQNSAKRLAMTGAIKDNVVDTEALACDLLAILRAHYEKNFRERYKLTEELPEDDYDLLGLISKKRGLILSGGRPDEERGAIMLLDEFRAGKLGRITLDDIEQLAPILKNIE
ncbi:MAG: ribosome biogenesis GTPase YlqF, partial [Clostridiales bacterium]|nr:ribosome biogenesis GTPase YlqF [Clostridiales bacterium]